MLPPPPHDGQLFKRSMPSCRRRRTDTTGSTSQRSAGRSLDCGRSEKSHAVRADSSRPLAEGCNSRARRKPLRSAAGRCRLHAQACAVRRRLPVRALARRAAASPREGPQLASARCVRFASCGSEKKVVPAVRCRSLASAKARNSCLLAACASQAAAPRKGRACRSMSQPRLCGGPLLVSARCVRFASCGSE